MSAAEPPPARPSHPLGYRIISISVYDRDLARIDALVKTLKARGLGRANRSLLFRLLVRDADVDKLARRLRGERS